MKFNKPKYLIPDLIKALTMEKKLNNSVIENKLNDFLVSALNESDSFLFPSNFVEYDQDSVLKKEDFIYKIFNKNYTYNIEDNISIEFSDDSNFDYIINILNSKNKIARNIMYTKGIPIKDDEEFYIIIFYSRDNNESSDFMKINPLSWDLPMEFLYFNKKGDKYETPLLIKSNSVAQDINKNELKLQFKSDFISLIYNMFFCIVNLLTNDDVENVYYSNEKENIKLEKQYSKSYRYKIPHYFFKDPYKIENSNNLDKKESLDEKRKKIISNYFNVSLNKSNRL